MTAPTTIAPTRTGWLVRTPPGDAVTIAWRNALAFAGPTAAAVLTAEAWMVGITAARAPTAAARNRRPV